MNTVDGSYTLQQIENIMDLAVVLLDHTDTLDKCPQIPGLLAQSLGIRSVALAVFRPQGIAAEADFVACCSSVHTSENEADLRRKLHGIYKQIQPFLDTEVQPACQTFCAQHPDQNLRESNACDINLASRAIVFTRAIDAAYRMLLSVEWHIGDAILTAELANNFSIIALELSKQLRCAVAWDEFPVALGAPFDTLSRPELKVLLGLTTDLAEKQLAAQLGLSHNTLHSHIKSIYRKIRVQGRIALLQRLRCAIHRMRIGPDWGHANHSARVGGRTRK